MRLPLHSIVTHKPTGRTGEVLERYVDGDTRQDVITFQPEDGGGAETLPVAEVVLVRDCTEATWIRAS